jgi:hypothetical protein
LPVPETRTDWLLFVLGIVVIAGLAVVVVQLHRHDPPRHPATTVSSPAPPIAATTTTSGATWIRLQLTALSPVPIEVRRGSSGGRSLYHGTLATGRSRSFAGARLWVHVGDGSAVSATLDGKKVVLSNGTQDAEITAAGVEPQQP